MSRGWGVTWCNRVPGLQNPINPRAHETTSQYYRWQSCHVTSVSRICGEQVVGITSFGFNAQGTGPGFAYRTDTEVAQTFLNHVFSLFDPENNPFDN